ncbi:MAG TPA: hypothetical protein VHZ73_01685 [Vicinamibacterales bacterium]|jgi:hypothetical protein|nr:hypothetical protein [Vicinamibacterales bacterium]
MRVVFHLNVSSMTTHVVFWAHTLGGSATGGDAVALKTADVRLAAREPTGGTKGTAVNHIAFAVPSVRRAVDNAQAAGYPIITRAELPERFEVRDDLAFIPLLDTSVAFTMGPDETKVEFIEVPGTRTIDLHHIHFFSPEPENLKMWYANLFHVQPADRGPFHAIDLPDGFNLTFSPSEPVQPTKGRAIDRIGFEVENAARFQTRELIDPWGTSIEITETK